MPQDSINRTDLAPDPFIWVIPLILNGLGVLMISSTTSYRSLATYGNPYLLGFRQVQFFFIGLFCMIIAYIIPIRIIKKMTGSLWLLALMLTWLTLVPGFNRVAGGASRWVQFGPFSFQPFELLLLTTVAHLTNRLTVEPLNRRRAFLRMSLLLFVAVLPLLFQPDLGGSILLVFLCMGIYVGAYGWLYPILGGSLMSLLGAFLISIEGYRMRRIWAFLDPWKDPRDSGFQVIQGLVAFANGGFWGVGLGKGLQKLHYLPASHTDFIFAVLAEELGYPGTMLVLGLYAAWTYRVMRLTMTHEKGFAALFSWALGLSVLLPMMINVGGVTKLLPLTGMPLPFLSYGGSSLVSMWLRIGLLLRLSKETKEVNATEAH